MSTYTVKPNDTLSKIAHDLWGDGTLYPRIFEANRHILPTADDVRPGQVLTIPDELPLVSHEATVVTTIPTHLAQVPGDGVRQQILTVASKRKGIPYRIDPPPDEINNLDCSLYVIVTYRDAGVGFDESAVRTAEQLRQACDPIAYADVEPGDLLFFQHTYEPNEPAGPDGHTASHIGIAIDGTLGTMWDCHESTIVSRGSGVAISDITTPYWQEHRLGAGRSRLLGGAPPIKAPPADLSTLFTPDEIRSVLTQAGGNVETYWPLLIDGMKAAGCCNLPMIVAVLATLSVEVPTFAPIHEYGDNAYFTSHYENRADLGNTQPGDGARFCGRGFIQLSGRANYQTYGTAVGIDLVANPDMAMNPIIAARVLVKFMMDKGIPAMAAAGNWQGVRVAVNGGLNGWDTFSAAVNDFLAVARSKGAL